MRNFRGKTQEVVVLHSENLNAASSTGEGVGREGGKTRAELQVLRTLSSSSCPLSELSTSPQSPPTSENKGSRAGRSSVGGCPSGEGEGGGGNSSITGEVRSPRGSGSETPCVAPGGLYCRHFHPNPSSSKQHF